MRKWMWLVALGQLLFAASPGLPGEGDTPPAVMRPPLPKVEDAGSYQGKVLAVTGDSITVQGLNLWRTCRAQEKRDRGVTTITGPVEFFRLERGKAIDVVSGVSATMTRDELSVTTAAGQVVTIRRSDLPPRKFRASAVLAGGGVPNDADDCRAYRLADVRVGDEVSIEGRKVDGVWECLSICIDRRPGGWVPPSASAGKTPPHPWHEWANAMQDWEEKGIPLPEKFNPPKLVSPTERPAVTVPDAIPPAK